MCGLRLRPDKNLGASPPGTDRDSLDHHLAGRLELDPLTDDVDRATGMARSLGVDALHRFIEVQHIARADRRIEAPVAARDEGVATLKKACRARGKVGIDGIAQ